MTGGRRNSRTGIIQREDKSRAPRFNSKHYARFLRMHDQGKLYAEELRASQTAQKRRHRNPLGDFKLRRLNDSF